MPLPSTCAKQQATLSQHMPAAHRCWTPPAGCTGRRGSPARRPATAASACLLTGGAAEEARRFRRCWAVQRHHAIVAWSALQPAAACSLSLLQARQCATCPPTHLPTRPQRHTLHTQTLTRVVLERGQRPHQVGQMLAGEVVGGRRLQQAARDLGGNGRQQALRCRETSCREYSGW